MAQKIFFTPTLYDDELTAFFAKVDLGPVVEGQFVANCQKYSLDKFVPDPSSLKVTNRPLTSALFFNQALIEGRPNPLYRVASHPIMRKLFSLYAYKVKIFQDGMLQAPPQMRALLPQTIVKVTKKHEEKGRKFDPDNFSFTNFNSFITVNRVRKLRPKDLDSMGELITETYRPFFSDVQEITPRMVMDYQIRMIDLAIAEKKRTAEQLLDL